MNPALKDAPTRIRRDLIQQERRRRRLGKWGPWEHVRLPAAPGRGWLSEVTVAHRNKVFAVLERRVEGAVHLAVSSLSEDRPTWWEMQRIKNELVGEDATAVEVYPPQSEVVDGADMFHLWVLDGPLPFTLSTTRRATA